MTSSQEIDELDIAAAQIASAILEFAQLGLPAAVRHNDELGGRLGDVAFKLFPDETVVARAEAPLALLNLPKPIGIASLAARGLFGVWRLDSESLGAGAYLERARQANLEALRKAVALYDLSVNTPVGLRVGDALSVFPVAALVRCFQDYVLFVSWVLLRPRPEFNSQARLLLIRADGECSTGVNVADVGTK